MAAVTVPPNYDLVKIAEDAGQPDNLLYSYTNGQLVVTGVTQSALDSSLTAYAAQHDTILLTTTKVLAKAVVDSTAGTSRLKYLTSIPGQAEVYQEKYDQAVDYITNSYPVDTTPYPMIQAEANATGNTPTECADNIVAERTTWLTKMSAIEEERRKGKINITAAVDVLGVDSARDTAIVLLNVL